MINILEKFYTVYLNIFFTKRDGTSCRGRGQCCGQADNKQFGSVCSVRESTTTVLAQGPKNVISSVHVFSFKKKGKLVVMKVVV